MNDNPTTRQGGKPEAQGYIATYVNGPAKGHTTETSVGVPPAYRYWCRLKDGRKSEEWQRGWWRWTDDGGGDMNLVFDDPDIDVAVYGLQSIARYDGEVKAKYGISERPSLAEKEEAPSRSEPESRLSDE